MLIIVIKRQLLKNKKRKASIITKKQSSQIKSKRIASLQHSNTTLLSPETDAKITSQGDVYVKNKTLTKRMKRIRSSTNIDEEHKYTEARKEEPKWYVRNKKNLYLPLYTDPAKKVDLKTFPGKCKVYVNGKYSWTSNVVDMMSAQSLWYAVQKKDGISIEPEKADPVVSVN